MWAVRHSFSHKISAIAAHEHQCLHYDESSQWITGRWVISLAVWKPMAVGTQFSDIHGLVVSSALCLEA